MRNFDEETKVNQDEEKKKNEHHMRLRMQSSLISSQIAPLFDRLGRMLMDISPHLAIMGSDIQKM